MILKLYVIKNKIKKKLFFLTNRVIIDIMIISC